MESLDLLKLTSIWLLVLSLPWLAPLVYFHGLPHLFRWSGALVRLPLALLTKDVIRQCSKNWDWEAQLLPEDTREELQTLQSILKNPRSYQRRWGQEPPLGMILYGPPGAGRSLIAQALAQSAGYRFMSASATELGETGIAELYQEARAAAPCVVFLADIEAITLGGHNAINRLLQETDGLGRGQHIFTVGATSELDALGKALLTRFPCHIFVGLPDETARARLFALYTHPYRKRLTYSLAELAKASEGLARDDIRMLCQMAAMQAHSKRLKNVGYREFAAAFKRLDRRLPPSASAAKREPCFVCAGRNSRLCPACEGTGWIGIVTSS